MAAAKVRRLKHGISENSQSPEGERNILEEATGDEMGQKLRDFRALAKRLREPTTHLPQTPAHVLIREDRDRVHDFKGSADVETF